LDGFDSVFSRESPHNQCQLTVGCRLDGSPISPLHVFGGVSTSFTTNFVVSFMVLHYFYSRRGTLRKM